MKLDANQSASLPLSSRICSAPTQTISKPRPMPSTGNLRIGVSRVLRPCQQTNAQNRPTGMLMKKIHGHRSEEHTSELQSLMRISYAVFCLKKKKNKIRDEKIKREILKNYIKNQTQYEKYIRK